MPQFSKPGAADRIGSLFSDRGATLLVESGFGGWEQALAGVPVQVLTLQGESDAPDGDRLLSRLRDHHAASGNQRAAFAETLALVHLRTTRLGKDHPDTLIEVGALGALLDRAGRPTEALPKLQEAWAGLRQRFGDGDMRVAIVAGNLGIHFANRGRDVEATIALEHAYRIRKQLAPRSTAIVAAQLAEMRLKAGKRDEAIPLLTEAWELAKERFGPTHERTVTRARLLVRVLNDLDRKRETIPVLRDLLAAAVEADDAELVATWNFELGLALSRVHLSEEGFRLAERAIEQTRGLGDPHPALPDRLSALAALVTVRGRGHEAEGLIREAVEAEERLYGRDSVEVAHRYMELGRYLVTQGRADEALGLYETATSLFRTRLGPEHAATQGATRTLVPLLVEQARAYHAGGDAGSALAILQHAMEACRVLGYTDPLRKHVEALLEGDPRVPGSMAPRKR